MKRSRFFSTSPNRARENRLYEAPAALPRPRAAESQRGAGSVCAECNLWQEFGRRGLRAGAASEGRIDGCG